MARDIMLTTIDNPYDPFDEQDKWYQYDLQQGYDCCGIVARLSATSAEFTEEKQMIDIEKALDDFLAAESIGFYKKVVRE